MDTPRGSDGRNQPGFSHGIRSDESFDLGPDFRPMSEYSKATEGLEDALQTLWKKGVVAWKDVPSATAWVEGPRGNTPMRSESDEPSGRISGRPESD